MRAARPRTSNGAWSTGELWILQARPVTTPCAPADAEPPAAGARGEVRLWDNSNIVENYPGVTTQLTFTFAQHVYSHVFREFARLIGIPPSSSTRWTDFSARCWDS